MLEPQPQDGKAIGSLYDQQAEQFAQFSDERFAFTYIEWPAFERYLSDLFTPQTHVLDIGCGEGVVDRHLISKNISPENIIGIDPSAEQIRLAQEKTPGVRFLQASGEDFSLPAGSMDLVVTNTVLHHLDNEQLEKMLEKIYEVLTPEGTYFLVEVDPDHSAEGRNSRNENQWTNVQTPWKTEVPFFNRHPRELMNLLDKHGFEKVSGWPLDVDEAGKVDPKEYTRYAGRPSRIAARFRKAPFTTKILRLHDVAPRNLVESAHQRMQRTLVDQYFTAWLSQSTELLPVIFSPDAVYDEKPGVEEPLVGLAEITRYWHENPLAQKKLQLTYAFKGYGADESAWAEFHASFEVKGKLLTVSGVIQFQTDARTRKIVKLKEYFTKQYNQNYE